MFPALLLFAATYVLMLVFSNYRPYLALGSALIFLVTGMLPLNEIIPNIDLNVLLMIAGTMGLVALFIESRMPELLADLVMEKVSNVQWAAVALFAGVISAYVDNVVTVLMVAPVAMEICKKLKTNPVPFISGLAVSSNLQGAATLVGDTTAIMLGSALDMEENNNKYRIPTVEDDCSVSSLLYVMLDAQRYETLMAETCTRGLMMLTSHVPDLVILDLDLPDCDGLDFIRIARQKSAVPILVLSTRSTEKDKVTALDLRPNDYITKPFSTAELLARVRAALRYRRPTTQSKLPESRFHLHDLTIEYESRTVMVDSQPIHLTQTEYNILAILAQHAGKLLTYVAMIEAIWDADDPGGNKKLQVNMANLRRKLGIRPGDNRYIVNELGVGYRMLQNEMEAEK